MLFANSPIAAQPVELATYMGELQRITHKLNLAVNAKNKELVKFYYFESLASISSMQDDVPEYESLAIAIMLDRIALPAYESFKGELLLNDKSTNLGVGLEQAFETIVKACNDCHQAANVGFIQIKSTTHNPFNQKF